MAAGFGTPHHITIISFWQQIFGLKPRLKITRLKICMLRPWWWAHMTIAGINLKFTVTGQTFDTLLPPRGLFTPQHACQDLIPTLWTVTGKQRWRFLHPVNKMDSECRNKCCCELLSSSMKVIMQSVGFYTNTLQRQVMPSTFWGVSSHPCKSCVSFLWLWDSCDPPLTM